MGMHIDLDGWDKVLALVFGDEPDPFSILGMHLVDGQIIVRAFLPGADRVRVFRASDNEFAAELEKRHDAGFFAGTVDGLSRFEYRLRAEVGERDLTIVDPYGFGSTLGDMDLHLHAEGTYLRSFEKMGAHPAE